MRIIPISLNKKLNIDYDQVACIGYFDGLHCGHQKLVEQTVALAKKYNAQPSLITFDPDPFVTIKGLQNVKHLSTMKQRINIAAKLGIKNIMILQFTKEMADLSPEDFVSKVLCQCNLKALICGFDFHYGAQGKGNALTLKASGEFEVEIVDSVNEEGQKISSSRIEELLTQGQIEHANKLLGYYYQVEGTIVAGHQKGGKIGFPTANIDLDSEFVLPKPGVYAGYINVDDKWYKAMVNLGHNPTFNYTEKLSLEAHIVDFNHDIYGKHIILEFVEYLREEKTFENPTNLVMQLESDINKTKKILKDHE